VFHVDPPRLRRIRTRPAVGLVRAPPGNAGLLALEAADHEIQDLRKVVKQV
jgi:hypothetical protein